jgi:uncharacterized membrane protein
MSMPKTTNGVGHVIERNICTMEEIKEREENRKDIHDRIAEKFTNFSGTMLFVYLNAGFFGVWILMNSKMFGLKPFDPFPFGMLTMIVSLEAIFLSLFVLITQNRMEEANQKKADLDLQINLLTEHEVTRLLAMVEAIANKVGVDLRDPELAELESDVEPKDVIKRLEEHQAGSKA